MMIRISALLLGMLSCAVLHAQETQTFARFYYRPAVGVHIPITPMLHGNVTDGLVEYDDRSNYLQLIAVTYFPYAKWGIDFSFQASSSKRLDGHSQQFADNTASNYGTGYYVDPDYSVDYENSTFIGGGIERVSLGVVRRIERSRWLLLPKISVGATSFIASSAQFHLKEKDSNTILKLNYTPDDQKKDFFTVAPAVSIAYSISRWISVSFDIQYSYFKSDLTYTKTLRDVYSGEASTEVLTYSDPVQTLSLGIGLIGKFRYVTRPRPAR